MSKVKFLTLAALILAIGFVGCKKDNEDDNPSGGTGNGNGTVYTGDILKQTPNLPSTPFNYANITLPNYLNTPPVNGQDNTPNNNPITDAGATLGRVLFYDKNVSANNTVACAGCHLQTNGFSDPLTFSKGFEGGLTGRNSMGIINARYYTNGRFFWDERAATLEEQTLLPIQDHVEMGMHLDSLVDKLGRIDYYASLFEDAFGDKAVTSDRVSKALSQFVRSIVSFNSKYDAGRANFPANTPQNQLPDFPNFTAQENRGKTIFFTNGGCAPCHGTEAFTARRAENNGLEVTSVDEGVGGFNNNAGDVGKFKVPSLRNIELTAPFMHDGRFATLEEVVEHYNSGVQAHPNLSPPLRMGGPNGQPRRLNLSNADKAALVAFLKTLTDNTVSAEAKYSSPF
jgi:cytochrome c peroxidase